MNDQNTDYNTLILSILNNRSVMQRDIGNPSRVWSNKVSINFESIHFSHMVTTDNKAQLACLYDMLTHFNRLGPNDPTQLINVKILQDTIRLAHSKLYQGIVTRSRLQQVGVNKHPNKMQS